MTPAKWRSVTQKLNKIQQLAADSTNAEQIARACDHLKRILKDKPTQPGKKGVRLRRVTFPTNCVCGQRMTVTVVFGKPPTFKVDEGMHVCRMWPAACKLVIDRARRVK